MKNKWNSRVYKTKEEALTTLKNHKRFRINSINGYYKAIEFII